MLEAITNNPIPSQEVNKIFMSLPYQDNDGVFIIPDEKAYKPDPIDVKKQIKEMFMSEDFSESKRLDLVYGDMSLMESVSDDLFRLIREAFKNKMMNYAEAHDLDEAAVAEQIDAEDENLGDNIEFDYDNVAKGYDPRQVYKDLAELSEKDLVKLSQTWANIEGIRVSNDSEFRSDIKYLAPNGQAILDKNKDSSLTDLVEYIINDENSLFDEDDFVLLKNGTFVAYESL